MRRITWVVMVLSAVLVTAGTLLFTRRVTAPEPSDKILLNTLLTEKSLTLRTFSLNASLIVLPLEAGSTQLGAQTNPVPVGKPALLTAGDVQEYVTIVEVNRGDSAWQRIQRYNAQNGPAARGKEYVLALVVVRFVQGSQEQAALHFQAISGNGVSREVPQIVQLRPDFAIDFTPDTMSGGWVAREVDPADPAPLLAVSVGSAHDDNPDVAYFELAENTD